MIKFMGLEELLGMMVLGLVAIWLMTEVWERRTAPKQAYPLTIISTLLVAPSWYYLATMPQIYPDFIRQLPADPTTWILIATAVYSVIHPVIAGIILKKGAHQVA